MDGEFFFYFDFCFVYVGVFDYYVFVWWKFKGEFLFDCFIWYEYNYFFQEYDFWVKFLLVVYEFVKFNFVVDFDFCGVWVCYLEDKFVFLLFDLYFKFDFWRRIVGYNFNVVVGGDFNYFYWDKNICFFRKGFCKKQLGYLGKFWKEKVISVFVLVF